MEPKQLATVSFRRVKNLGNYESEELKIELQQQEGESVNECITKVKGLVYEGLGISTPKVLVPEQPVQAPAPKVEPVVEEKKDDAPVQEVKEVVVAVEPEPVAKKAKSAPKKRASTAPTVYDRNNPTHRDMLGKVIAEVTANTNWVKDAGLKAIAVELSHSLVGKDFVEINGEFCESFMSNLRTAFNK